MNVFVNDQVCEVVENQSLYGLMTTVLQSNMAGVAVALNDVVVPRSLWENTFLSHNDHLLVIKACSGG